MDGQDVQDKKNFRLKSSNLKSEISNSKLLFLILFIASIHVNYLFGHSDV